MKILFWKEGRNGARIEKIENFETQLDDLELLDIVEDWAHCDRTVGVNYGYAYGWEVLSPRGETR